MEKGEQMMKNAIIAKALNFVQFCWYVCMCLHCSVCNKSESNATGDEGLAGPAEPELRGCNGEVRGSDGGEGVPYGIHGLARLHYQSAGAHHFVHLVGGQQLFFFVESDNVVSLCRCLWA